MEGGWTCASNNAMDQLLGLGLRHVKSRAETCFSGCARLSGGAIRRESVIIGFELRDP